MKSCYSACLMLLACFAGACGEAPDRSAEFEAFGRGPYAVGSTNLEILPGYADQGDDVIHGYLIGSADESGRARNLADILKHPESAWVTDVPVPDRPALYGPASGLTLPVVTFLTYPTVQSPQKNRYAFPYHDARYGLFEDMLAAGEAPVFAEPIEKYPLILIAHGALAHGIYDVRHAHNLSSHGFIVAVINYGDARTAYPDDPNHHVSFLRPLLTKAVLNTILESETFGARVDTDNIGITGHSLGGFTALTMTGGPFQGNAHTVSDSRIKAATIAAPWVGESYGGEDFFAFAPRNSGLSRVTVPIICLFSTRDEITPASFILPAMAQLSGPTYVVELHDQPHIFEQGSWEDRDNWELLFFSAYLKQDARSLELLRISRSAAGGNEDTQLFDYQVVPDHD